MSEQKPRKARRSCADRLITAADDLCQRLNRLTFQPPVTHVYNPLNYASEAHNLYLNLVPDGGSEIMFLGMNPGPWGMAQSGVPFGEIDSVKGFLNIEVPVERPLNEHPKRPIQGFQCSRSEVSGRRLWGLFADRFGTAKAFCERHFVMNYCPLVFMESSGRNRTPDKLPSDERGPLDEACDQHLAAAIEILSPKYLVGVGVYAEKCLKRVSIGDPKIAEGQRSIHRILHPSPASPAANKDWGGQATSAMVAAGIWPAVSPRS